MSAMSESVVVIAQLWYLPLLIDVLILAGRVEAGDSFDEVMGGPCAEILCDEGTNILCDEGQNSQPHEPRTGQKEQKSFPEQRRAQSH